MSMPESCAIVEKADGQIIAVSTLVGELEDSTVVAKGTAGAEGAHGGEDIAEGRLAAGSFLQALITEEFAGRIFRLGDAIGDQHQAVARLHLSAAAGVGHIRQQADGHVGFEQTRYRSFGNQHRRHMAAVEELKLTIRL